MNNARKLKIVIGVQAVALLVSLGFLARSLWNNFLWESEVFALAGAAGTRHAMDDFRHGRLRLLSLDGENKTLRYSGTDEGPFEIWIPHFYPTLGYPHRFSTEQQVNFYNRKMRHMHAHPERFVDRDEVAAPRAP